MTTEEDFQAALDAQPDDWQTRLVFADWLDERGDPRAGYFRAAGYHRWRPDIEDVGMYDPSTLKVSGVTGFQTWRFWAEYASHSPPHATLPFDMGWGRWLHNTRREAEDAAALAFSQLPAARRAELLAVPAREAG